MSTTSILSGKFIDSFKVRKSPMTETLPRVLEPEVMDTDEEAQDYDAMDHSVVNDKFADNLLAAWNDRAPALENDRSADVLDLGTGTAQIPIVLARKWDRCRIMAVDAAVSMLEIARYNLEIAGLIERIQLAHVDAKTLSFPVHHFDVVMSNSIVHHIPEPKNVLTEALRVLRPGGLLFFRDLFRPVTLSQLEHLVETYAGNENEHSRRMFAESLHAALSLDEIRALVGELGGDPSDVQATSDRHWTWIHWK
jgi:ubiquinone/menaquinone biosynthesis C-methylase UbiE